MARKPLRSQLNQIRAWVREGRTDAWIAHQLDVSAAELREFRRRYELAPGEEPSDLDLRDEIEAEIEAAMEEGTAQDEEAEQAQAPESGASEPEGEEERPRRRRRRRRRGRSEAATLEATFDHGERDGYGLWLDPAIKDNPIYAEHWAGHRAVEVTIDPDQIVIRRSGSGAPEAPEE